MHRPDVSLSCTALLWLLAAPLAAQALTLPSPASLTKGASVQYLDGALIGVGPHYKARFADGAVTFTPAFGRSAPATRPVRLTLLGVGRGETSTRVRAALPELRGQRVEVEHGTFTERYDLRPDGVEQSFVFAALPEGEGDLVVRQQVDTELQVEPHACGLRFTYQGVGSFDLGAVTGIDATGTRCAGAMRLEHGVLELSLPAAFVAGARLPLVLDPLIGASFNVIAATSSDEEPRTAYALSANTYLVAWTRVNSATDTDVLGQRVAGGGSLVGNVVSIAAQAGLNDSPSVASIRMRDAFLVAYVRNDDVLCRSVSATTGAVSLAATLAGGSNVQRLPDVGGEATLVDDDGVVVWVDYGTNSIHSVEVGVNSDLSVVARGATRVVFHDPANAPCDFPRISKCGGTSLNSRRYGVTCTVIRPGTLDDPVFVVVDDSGLPATTSLVLTNAATRDYVATSDGDGSNWIVAWEHLVGTVPGIEAVSVSYAPSTVVPFLNGTVQTLATTGRLPAVTWLGQSCLVSWFERTGNTAVCRLASRDLLTCSTCEPPAIVPGSADLDFTAYGASTASGGGTNDIALLVLATVQATSGNSDIQGALWRTADGLTLDLGGGCGPSGQPFAACLLRGNADFAFRLRGANPGFPGPAALVLSRDRIDLPCGDCRLVPDPASGVVIVTSIDGVGRAAIPLAVPTSAVGTPLYAQWVVATFARCPALGSSLSPAHRLILQ